MFIWFPPAGSANFSIALRIGCILNRATTRKARVMVSESGIAIKSASIDVGAPRSAKSAARVI